MIQINPFSPIVKELFKYLGWVLLFFCLWFKGCSDNQKTVTTTEVTVPEVKGKFEPQQPVNVPIAGSPKIKIVPGETVFVPNPINQKLIAENEKLKKDFAIANDSIQKLQFAKAVELSEFSSDFNNDDMDLNISGIAQGKVLEITPNYTIKKKKTEVAVKSKETVFRVLTGGELGNNKQIDGFTAKANLMFQNRKGNIISGSFDTNQNIWIGYNFSILNIKR